MRHVGLWTVQDGFDPLEMLENVEIRYRQHEKSHKIISTPESISELKLWRDQANSESTYVVDVMPQTWLLPDHGM
jgi:hypothetical protein